MKLKHGGVLLFLAYVIRQVTPQDTDRIFDLLEHLHLSRNSNPLIVVVNKEKQLVNTQEFNNYDDHFVTKDDDDDDFHKDKAIAEAKYLLYNYLTREPRNIEEAVKDKRQSLQEALRSSCQARVECEKKCDEKEKKKDKYCPVNCKAVFDKLDLCEPPKKDKCYDSWEEEDKCKKNNRGKQGKTMPPKWRF